MSLLTPSPNRTPSPADTGRTDLIRAWLAVGVMVVGLTAMPLVGSDWEPEFWVSALALGAVMVVVASLVWAAIHFGRRAQRAGRQGGLLAAVVAGTVGGWFLLLWTLSIVAHLAGFE